MSTAPKRLHEDGSHLTSSKHTPEDTGALHNTPSGKLAQIVTTEYPPQPFDPGSDGRPAKLARIEPRESEKRLSLHPMYRMPSSSNDPGVDHLVTSENRGPRETKDNRDAKVENKDTKIESRVLYTEARIDPQCAKGEKAVRLESRTDDNSNHKESKNDGEPIVEYKGDIKAKKDSAGNSNQTWKEHKEHQRGKQATDGFDPWRISRSMPHVPTESGKEVMATEGRECSEAHEAVGENKVDIRGDDKVKDKEKKRKDEKHEDWGERGKDRLDYRNPMQLGNTSSECRETTRAEREPERWDKERKDLQKEKERLREREKDQMKKEDLKGFDKEGSQNERELLDASVRTPELEKPALEQRKHKESSVDRDSKERKKDKDVDLDVDRKLSKCSEKEPDEGGVEGDGGTIREREGFGHGIQRKRMLRPRGSPLTNREPRFRSRSRDNEELQDEPEVSTVVYRVGECMQELIKLWEEFSASQDNKNDETSSSGPTLEIRIPAEYVTATNRQVRGGQLWGTDVYTDDSDLVAVLMHTGYCRPTASPPPPAILELRATVRILPPQECYISSLRNNVRSRSWGAAIGCSYRVERCCIVKKGGGTIDLEPCLTHTSSLEPTLAPVAVERAMTTRAAASNASRQQKFVREVTIQYNLCNEPWIKYSISIVADKGLKKPLYTSARLKKGEVLYLETHSTRYELCFNGEKTISSLTTTQVQETDKEKLQNSSHEQNGERSHLDRDTMVDVFRWSRCKKPLPQNVMRSIGIPLPLEHVEVLEENLDWEDVQWSQTSVWIAGKEYALARVHFLSPH